MKKIIIGCCLTIVGAFSNVALWICASHHVDTLGSWSTPPGKFMTAITNTGLSVLIIPIIIATLLFVLGLYFLFEEYLMNLIKKNKNTQT